MSSGEKRTMNSHHCPPQSKQPKFDFRSMAYFEQYPSEPRIDEEDSSATVQRGQGDRSAEDKQQQQPLYKEITNHVHKMERFAVQRHVTEFMLNAQHEQPDEALRQAFKELIARAVQNAEKESGRTVSKLGIMVTGRGLNDPVVLPIRPPVQNNVDVVMAELDKLGQSEGDEGGADKKTLLLSEPVEIIVTCLTTPTGSGPKHHPYQNWGYNEAQRIRIFNKDNYCLFHALVAGRAYHDHEICCTESKTRDGEPTFPADIKKSMDFCKDHEALNRLLSNAYRMRSAVHELMNGAGIPDDKEAYGIEEIQSIQIYWDTIFPGIYRIVLFEDRPEELPRPLWKGSGGRRFNVVLFMSNKHFDAIKKIHCFFNLGRKYCVECECTYTTDSKHTFHCKSRCPQCAKVGPQYPCPKQKDVRVLCPECNRYFFSITCYNEHRGPTCRLYKRCSLCNRVYRSDTGQKHKCHTSYCKRCKVYHAEKTSCFIKKVKIPKDEQCYRIVVWDTETRLEKLAAEGQRVHMVNFLSARVTCTDCCDSSKSDAACEICCQNDGGLERTKEWSEANNDEEPVAAFVEWILKAWNKQYKTYIWAHNASRFDGHFALNYLCKTARRPDVVMNGLKIFEFRVQHSRKHSMLIWRDSCLIIPLALADLKKTFNLDCEEKPFFPYAFNRKENYTVRLGQLPDESEYDPGSMKAEKCEKFKKWYNENKNTPFFLPDELRTYCLNDTEILLKALVKFRHILMHEITGGFDVLPISCTIASACMNIFKAQFMQQDQLAMVPELGYERNDRASVLAIKYLDWRVKSEGIEIQHAGNGREKCWKNFKLDGWIESQHRCIEVLGCYWHGCEKCFKPDEQLVDGKTCRELYETTQDRLHQLREPDVNGLCLQVEEIWECEINDQLKKNAEMKSFFDDLANERGPLDPRLAYCGGRTGPLRLFAEPSEDEKISVFDIVSLYPWVNFDTAYPIGVPSIVRPSAEEMIVNWTKPEELKYRGLYRVRVIPPRGLRIPVLPMKIDERLLFSCCHRCAAMFRKNVTRCSHKCEHSEQQRAFTGNFTHIELEKALEMGYIVDRFWRAWHYDEWSDQIFKEYVRQFIKLKVESSGFPDGVETSKQKQQYIDEYRQIYGVDLDSVCVKKNPGLRFIAKLMLNSLWGKFSMRNQLGSNKVITRPQEFYDLVLNHRMEISSIVPISDAAIRVLYKPKKNFIEEHKSSNIVLSLWTTSRARLKLLEYMLQCHNTPGAELLYTDTDSVIVRHKRDSVPVQTGEYLGQMSEEYSDYNIVSFACGGAKQYALKMIHKETGAVKYVQKIRGITFDVNNSQKLQFERFVHKVINYGGEEEQKDAAVFNYNKIQPTKDNRIITRKQNKKYLPVCQKGIISENLEVLPFGYE